MNLRSRLKENARSGVTCAAVTALLGFVLMLPRVGNGLKHLSFDLPMLIRPDVDIANEKVVILYMDATSTDRLNQTPGKPWDRSIYTRLLSLLTAQKAEIVVFDVLLDKAQDPKLDADLADAIKAHGKVILAADMKPLHGMGQTFGHEPVLPLDILRSASYGMDNLFQESDGAVRRHYYPTEHPGMALTVALALGKNPATNEVSQRWINYYGREGTIRPMSFYQAFDSLSASNLFTGKRVFVGRARSIDFNGTKYESLSTPLGEIPAVEVLATTCLNFMRGDWLEELSGVATFSLLLLTGLLTGFGFSVVRPWVAAGIGLIGSILIVTGALLVVWHYRVWFPWLIPAGVQIPFAVAWTVLWNTKSLYHEKEVLEQKLATATSTPPRTSVPAQSEPELASASSDSPTRLTPTRPTAPPTELAPEIPDHELLRRIGKGGYGEVWLARDVIGTFHAVKIIYRKTFDNDGPFEREFKGIQKFTPISLSHPGFVHVLHVGRKPGYFYYIMEVGDDETTGQKIEPATYSPKNLAKEIGKRGKYPLDECLQLSLELASALDYLHQQQLIHRDIKPSNIIFVNGVPKIADIGLVTSIAATGHDVTYLGTEGYIPPEGPGNAAGDVYSLGKLIYEVSMGRNPGYYPEPPTAMAEKPDEHRDMYQLHEIILKACKPDVRVRYQTMGELRTDLLRLQTQLQTQRVQPSA